MKMKPTWSKEEDHNQIRNVGTTLIGRMVCCFNYDDEPRPDYVLSTLHIIGWDTSKSEKDGGEYFTFTSLSDGMTCHYTLDRLIEVLNGQPYVPAKNSEVLAALNFKIPKL